MHKFNHIRQVAPMCLYGRTCRRHLSNNIEPSGNDAHYVKLKMWANAQRDGRPAEYTPCSKKTATLFSGHNFGK